MYEVFFDLEDNLCVKYPALTPFAVRREKFGEVVKLVQRIKAKNRVKQGIKNTDQVIRYANGDVHIRRPAQNDDWY